jgi:hypothetical protein
MVACSSYSAHAHTLRPHGKAARIGGRHQAWECANHRRFVDEGRGRVNRKRDNWGRGERSHECMRITRRIERQRYGCSTQMLIRNRQELFGARYRGSSKSASRFAEGFCRAARAKCPHAPQAGQRASTHCEHASPPVQAIPSLVTDNLRPAKPRLPARDPSHFPQYSNPIAHTDPLRGIHCASHCKFTGPRLQSVKCSIGFRK